MNNFKYKFTTILSFPLLLISCEYPDHDLQEPDGHHAHHAEKLGNEPIVVTHFNGVTELFMDYSPLVQGISSNFAVHLTRMDNFKPIRAGTLKMKLVPENGNELVITKQNPSNPGIYLFEATPKFTGSARMEISLNHSDINSSHAISQVFVFASQSEIKPKVISKPQAEQITFLKEQQWRTDYKIEQAGYRDISYALPATGVLRLPASSIKVIPATASGTVLWSKKNQNLKVGMIVPKSMELFIIQPDAAWESGLARLKEQYLLAKLECDKMEELFQQEAVAERRVQEARIRKNTLSESLSRMGVNMAAGEFLDLEAQVTTSEKGMITKIMVRPGQKIQQGDPLAMIKNTQTLVLEARVPSTRIQDMSIATDATFRMGAGQKTYRISELGGRPVSEKPLASGTSGFAHFLFEFGNADGQFIEGTSLAVQILGSEKKSCLAISVDAVQEELGDALVYVQSSGETIEKRFPKLGIQDGQWIEVKEGIDEGEQVVTKGATQIRLSSLGGVEMGHGHAH